MIVDTGNKVKKTISINSRPQKDKLGNVTGAVTTFVDITKELKSKKALINSEKKYRDLFTLSTDACLILRDGIYVDCNKAAYTSLGMTSKNQLIGLKPKDVAPEFQEDGSRSENIADEKIDIVKNQHHHRFEWLHKKITGELFYSEVLLTKMEDLNGEFVYVIWRDISDRKHQEKLILESLKEKEVLLSEVHHRVKNNLAIISGMIQLQAFSSKNSQEVKELAKSVNRIKSIAIIHEQLYKTGNYAAISMEDNIKQQLEGLIKLYSNDKKNISINLNLEEVHININQAIPLSLFINEVATNSLKYAFEGKEKGEISVNIKLLDNDTIQFLFKDDGIGFEIDKSRNSKDSLGYSLIEAFVSQLHGKLTLDSRIGKGTSISLIFKRAHNKGANSNLNSQN